MGQLKKQLSDFWDLNQYEKAGQYLLASINQRGITFNQRECDVVIGIVEAIGEAVNTGDDFSKLVISEILDEPGIAEEIKHIARNKIPINVLLLPFGNRKMPFVQGLPRRFWYLAKGDVSH